MQLTTLEINFQPRNAAEALRYAKSADKAETMGREGYALSESIIYDQIFLVHTPEIDGVYIINASEKTCNCADFENRKFFCKHLLFVAKCLRYAAQIK